jgi:hypothetical protein
MVSDEAAALVFGCIVRAVDSSKICKPVPDYTASSVSRQELLFFKVTFFCCLMRDKVLGR